ncbi:MAG: adenylate kinase [Chlamydiae bacterium]|nr:adenylate kinase [Chlamydiota bacterium]
MYCILGIIFKLDERCFVKYPTFLIFGPPGSGKGTQGKSLCELRGFVHVSSGDVIRHLDPDSEQGQLFFKYANRGELAPNDGLIVDIVRQYIEMLINTHQFDPKTQKLLLDGVPRTKTQAKLIESYCDILGVIVLQSVDNQELTERLRQRAQIEGRLDDQKEEVLVKRFKVYEQQTQEVLSHYPSLKQFKVNCLQSKSKVLEDILNIIPK